MEDLTNALAYEIKQEIADRYFSFRKRIESESLQYSVNLKKACKTKVYDVKINLQRMQCLLVTESIYFSFLTRIGLRNIAPDEITSFSPVIHWQDIAGDLKGEGFTRRRRYNSLVYTTYQLLADSITRYRECYTELSEEHAHISKEIKRFYRNNDLSGILSFIRRIDTPEVEFYSGLQPETFAQSTRSFEQDLRIHPPSPVGDHLHDLPEIEPLKIARSELKRIIDRAYPFVRDNKANSLPI
ncbi:MAG: hypothetical protein ACN4GW_20045 [Desulforhopalus sp.]